MISFEEMFPIEERRVEIPHVRRETRRASAESETTQTRLETVFAGADPLPTEGWHLPHLQLNDYYV